MKLLEDHPGIEVVGEAMNADEAIQMVSDLNPDLLFLDVELQTGTGFDVLDQVGDIHFDIVFTTAFEQRRRDVFLRSL